MWKMLCPVLLSLEYYFLVETKAWVYCSSWVGEQDLLQKKIDKHLKFIWPVGIAAWQAVTWSLPQLLICISCNHDNLRWCLNLTLYLVTHPSPQMQKKKHSMLRHGSHHTISTLTQSWGWGRGKQKQKQRFSVLVVDIFWITRVYVKSKHGKHRSKTQCFMVNYKSLCPKCPSSKYYWYVC